MMPSGERHQTCPAYCPTPTPIISMGLRGPVHHFQTPSALLLPTAVWRPIQQKPLEGLVIILALITPVTLHDHCDEACQPVPVSPPPLGSPMQELPVKVLSHPGRGHSGSWIVATGLCLEDVSPLTQEPSPVLRDLIRFIRQNNAGEAPLCLSRRSFVVSLFFTGTLNSFQNSAINILRIVLIQRSVLSTPAHLLCSILFLPIGNGL